MKKNFYISNKNTTFVFYKISNADKREDKGIYLYRSGVVGTFKMQNRENQQFR